MDINNEIVKYIEETILPIYEKNDEGHGIKHVYYVIKRCLELKKEFEELNLNIIYVAAAYHDIAHHIDKNIHEILSANIFMKDNEIKKFFTESEIIIIKEAIEDHRASSKTPPRSIYGKILSSADRCTNIDDFISRMYYYMKNHFPNRNLEEIMDKSFLHMQKKYGHSGYAKTYIEDTQYQNFKKDIEILSQDKIEFQKRYLKVLKNLK